MEKYTIFSLKLANSLIAAGHNYLGSGIDLKNDKYKVFFFEKTPPLMAAIKDYQRHNDKKKIWT